MAASTFPHILLQTVCRTLKSAKPSSVQNPQVCKTSSLPNPQAWKEHPAITTPARQAYNTSHLHATATTRTTKGLSVLFSATLSTQRHCNGPPPWRRRDEPVLQGTSNRPASAAGAQTTSTNQQQTTPNQHHATAKLRKVARGCQNTSLWR